MSKVIAHDLDNKQRTEDVLTSNDITFQSLLLPNHLIGGLLKSGFKKPSPVQLKALPVGRCGFDLMVRSKSGTGKTLIFALIALETVDVSKPETQVLIVAPTREIALQIQDLIQSVGCEIKGLNVELFIGGLKYAEDKKKLEEPCHIAVGTPGRLLHLMKKYLKTDAVRLFVLDEADKLTESIFINSINELYNSCPSKKQVITTSATYPYQLEKFIEQYMLSPTFITDEQYTPLLLGLKQFVKAVKRSNTVKDSRAKNAALLEIFSNLSFTQCLVFSNYKVRSESIANFLNQNGWPTTYISAAQPQEKRLEAMTDLKELKCKILTTTDLTARGVDAANVDLVINYDLPTDPVTYLHRMGRAGRFGSSGACINLALEGCELKYLQQMLGTIGGATLSIANLPNFTGTVSDLLTMDIPEEQYIFSIVPDESEIPPCPLNFRKDIVGMRLKEKLPPKKEYPPKKKKDKKKKRWLIDELGAIQSNDVSDEYPGTSPSKDLMNILKDGQNELDEMKEYMANVNEENILQSLASGDFNFENLNLKSDNGPKTRSALREFLSQQLLPGPSTSTPACSQNKVEINLDTVKVNLKEKLLCRNKGLVEVAKILDDPSSSQEVDKDSVNQYLNLLKAEEQENISNLADSTNISDLLEALEHVESSVNVKKNNTKRSIENDKNKRKSKDNIDDIENIFVLGFDTIVKQNGELWKKQLNNNSSEHSQSYQETYDEEEDEILDEGSEDGEPEIMKWVPVKKNKKQLTFSENENSFVEFNSSGMDWTEGTFSQACVQEANNSVDKYEHFTGYFDSCSDILWDKGLTLPNVQSFDDWFFYEWEAQVVAVRNYIQQNIYVQEMNKFKRSRRSTES